MTSFFIKSLERLLGVVGLFERTMVDTPKLSAVLREIAPSSERTFRDRYVMDFLGKKSYVDEYSMKQAIISKMKDFILEVGKDFIYMGQEYRLQVGAEDFRIDSLSPCYPHSSAANNKCRKMSGRKPYYLFFLLFW